MIKVWRTVAALAIVGLASIGSQYTSGDAYASAETVNGTATPCSHPGAYIYETSWKIVDGWGGGTGDGPASYATSGDLNFSYQWSGSVETQLRVIIDGGTPTPIPYPCGKVSISGLSKGPHDLYVQSKYANAEEHCWGCAIYEQRRTTVYVGSAPLAPARPEVTSKTATSVSLSWVKPDDGGVPLTDFRIEYSTNGTTWSVFNDGTSTETSTTVTGLNRGSNYSFRVSATNPLGTSGPSVSSASVIPSVVPTAPSAPTITARTSSSVSLSWNTPDDGGRPIFDYRIEYSADNTNWIVFSDSFSSSTSTTLTGLVPGSNYRARVTAINAVGPGPASATSTSFSLSAVPQPTTDITATWASTTSAVISWTAPSGGGRPILDYKVEYSEFGMNWTEVTHAASISTSITIPGLKSNKNYWIRVRARNSDGFGPVAASRLIAADIPSSPTRVVGVAGNSRVKVSWSAPSSNGGAAITQYTVTASPGGERCVWTDGPLNCLVGGLSNATEYTFTVEASNLAGTGSASTPSNPVTPRTVPTSPLGSATILSSNAGIVTAVATDTVGNTHFVGLGRNTAFRISPIGVTATLGSGFLNPSGIAVDSIGRVFVADTGNNRVVRIALNGTLSTIGAGLKAPKGLFVASNGDLYIADSGNNRIVKITSAGTQTVLGSGFTAPSGVALDATGFIYVADSGNNRIVKIGVFGIQTTIGSGFTNPTALGIDGAGSVYVADSGNNRIVKITSGGAQSEIKAGFVSPSGLVVNAGGDLTIADTSNSRILRLTAAPTAKATTGQVSISWSAPSFNGGAPITGYKVTAVGSPTKTCSTTDATTCVITGLTPGVSYTFTVVAINEAGSSAPSAPTQAVIAS